jgi:hypothetical protein
MGYYRTHSKCWTISVLHRRKPAAGAAQSLGNPAAGSQGPVAAPAPFHPYLVRLSTNDFIVMLAPRDRLFSASSSAQPDWRGGWRWPLGH